MRPLAFYDYHRQRYAEQLGISSWSAGVVAEFMIGDYERSGESVEITGDRGEFKIALYEFRPRPGNERDLSPHIEVFDDAYPALMEFIAEGGLAAIKRATIHTREEFSRLLIVLGLVDVSDYPLKKTDAKASA